MRVKRNTNFSHASYRSFKCTFLRRADLDPVESNSTRTFAQFVQLPSTRAVQEGHTCCRLEGLRALEFALVEAPAGSCGIYSDVVEILRRHSHVRYRHPVVLVLRDDAVLCSMGEHNDRVVSCTGTIRRKPIALASFCKMVLSARDTCRTLVAGSRDHKPTV
jgi:hypothetical protein